MSIAAFSESSRSRFALGTLLYLAQGFPQAVVFYSIATWLAVSGRGVAEITSVSAAATLAWALKGFAGPIIDRFTWAPMGRRRPWLIGSQILIFGALLAFAALGPSSDEIAYVTGFVVVIAAAAAVQDTALDALVIDLTPEDEKGRLNGFMMTGKLLGMASGMAVGGYLLEHFGIGTAMLAMALLFAIPATVAILVRERPGEKLLPWSPGEATSAGRAATPANWRVLGKVLLTNLKEREALLVIAFLGTFGVAAGLYQQGMVLFGTRQLGWGEAGMGALGAASYVALAGPALLLGGLIDRIGPRRIGWIGGIATFTAFGALPLLPFARLGDAYFAAWVLLSGIAAMLMSLIGLVMAMRVSLPEVAATSFAVLMLADSLGGWLGINLLPVLEVHGGFGLIFWVAAILALMAGCVTLGSQPNQRVETERLS